MREIVEVGSVGRLFFWLAILTPLVGLTFGAVIGGRTRQLGRGLRTGALCGLVGPFNWTMWQVYNLLTDRNGLDTVQNVFVNLAVFVIVGAGIGAGMGLMVRKSQQPRLTSAALTPEDGGTDSILQEDATDGR